MSKYTTEVRFICESVTGLSNSVGANDIDNVIAQAVQHIFNFNFPLFDASYKGTLCTKILRHYYTREIGLETYGLWKLKLETKLTEIMPYYNKLYESELLKFNPFYDVDLNRSHDMTNDEKKNKSNTSKQNTSGEFVSTNNSTDYDLYSDTPQGALSGVESGEYLTTANKTTGSDSETGKNSGVIVASGSENGTLNTTEKYLESVSGKQGTQSYSSMLKEYRETFLNIDMMVINELSDLFINIW